MSAGPAKQESGGCAPSWIVAPAELMSATLTATAPRFLVHQTRYHLGDTLWLTPLLRAIRRRFPGARTTVAAPPWLRPVLRGNRHLVSFLPVSTRAEKVDFAGGSRPADEPPFDIALFAFGRWGAGPLLARAALEAGVPYRVNLEYYGPGARRAAPWEEFTHEGWFSWGSMASPLFLLRSLEPFLDPYRRDHREILADRRIEFPISATTRRRAGARLRELGLGHRPLAILAPGGHSSQRWPGWRFARLARWLVDRCGMEVLLEGSADDRQLMRWISGLARGQPGGRRVTAGVAWSDDALEPLAAMLERSALLVANDSGPIHLAEVTGTPTLYFGESRKRVHSGPGGLTVTALLARGPLGAAQIPVARAAEAIRQMGRRGWVPMPGIEPGATRLRGVALVG